jgi:hypothetical protein
MWTILEAIILAKQSYTCQEYFRGWKQLVSAFWKQKRRSAGNSSWDLAKLLPIPQILVLYDDHALTIYTEDGLRDFRLATQSL